MSLYKEVAGSGPEVVLLHGWGMHSGIFDELAQGLALEYRVTRIDLPGFGRSPALERFQLHEVAAAVADAAPQEAAWVGWSLGGMIATRVALDRPQQVTHLGLVGSSPRFVRGPHWDHGQDPEVLAQFATDLTRDYQGTLQRFLALEVRGSDHARDELRILRERLFQHGEPQTAALEGGLDILQNDDMRLDFSGLECPVAAILGERDGLVPAAVGADMQRLLPSLQLTTIKGAGHAPFLSHSDDFMHALRGLLHA